MGCNVSAQQSTALEQERDNGTFDTLSNQSDRSFIPPLRAGDRVGIVADPPPYAPTGKAGGSAGIHRRLSSEPSSDSSKSHPLVRSAPQSLKSIDETPVSTPSSSKGVSEQAPEDPPPTTTASVVDRNRVVGLPPGMQGLFSPNQRLTRERLTMSGFLSRVIRGPSSASESAEWVAAGATIQQGHENNQEDTALPHVPDFFIDTDEPIADQLDQLPHEASSEMDVDPDRPESPGLLTQEPVRPTWWEPLVRLQLQQTGPAIEDSPPSQ
jgi:hypothetical protein